MWWLQSQNMNTSETCSCKWKRHFKYFNIFLESRAITYPCKCEESRCSCCSGNILQNFNINFRQRLCTNISYNADDFEFNVRILFNDYTMLNRVVSGIINRCYFTWNFVKFTLLCNSIKRYPQLRLTIEPSPPKSSSPSLTSLHVHLHCHGLITALVFEWFSILVVWLEKYLLNII